MKKKIVGIFVVTLLIATAVLPVVGTMNNFNIKTGELIALNERVISTGNQDSGFQECDEDWEGASGCPSMNTLIWHKGNVLIGNDETDGHSYLHISKGTSQRIIGNPPYAQLVLSGGGTAPFPLPGRQVRFSGPYRKLPSQHRTARGRFNPNE